MCQDLWIFAHGLPVNPVISIQVQERFDVDIQVMPDQVEPEKYINST